MLSRVLSGIGAAVSAVGVHTAMVGDMHVGWSMTITIPPLLVFLHAVWDWMNQMALNQLVYSTAVETRTVAVEEPKRPGLVDPQGAPVGTP